MRQRRNLWWHFFGYVRLRCIGGVVRFLLVILTAGIGGYVLAYHETRKEGKA